MEALTTDRLPSREEIDAYSDAAEKIYEPLRPELEARHWGKYITIHPITGEYAIGRTLRSSDKKLRKKYPNMAFVINRIGAVGHFGGTGASDGKRPKGGKHAQLSNDEEPAIGTQLLQGSVATLDFVKNRLMISEP